MKPQIPDFWKSKSNKNPQIEDQGLTFVRRAARPTCHAPSSHPHVAHGNGRCAQTRRPPLRNRTDGREAHGRSGMRAVVASSNHAAPAYFRAAGTPAYSNTSCSPVPPPPYGRRASAASMPRIAAITFSWPTAPARHLHPLHQKDHAHDAERASSTTPRALSHRCTRTPANKPTASPW